MQSTSPLSESEERIAQRVAALISGAQSQPHHYTVAEVAQRLKCSERQVWRLISLGQLHARKLAGKTIVDRAEYDRYYAEAR